MSNKNLLEQISQLLINSNEPLLQKGAKLGWVLPLELPYSEYKRVLKTNDPKDVDDYFIEYYSDNFDLHLKKKTLNDFPFSGYMKELIEEVINCYESKLFLVCIPALFSLVEGLLVDVSNKGERINLKYRKGIEDKIRSNTAGVNSVPLLSLSWFLHTTFGASNFEQEDFLDFDILNRHWSQHGRYLTSPNSKKSTIQLLSVVALILYIHESTPNADQP